MLIFQDLTPIPWDPLKKANFPQGLEKFESAASYSEWIFEYIPGQKP